MTNESTAIEEPREFHFGKWVTKREFIFETNEAIGGRAGFVERNHDNGILTLSIAFEGA